MEKRETAGVKRLPFYFCVIRTVKKVAGQRMPKILHVDTDLMGTPCVKAEPDEGISALGVKEFIMGTGRFTVFKVHPAFDGRSFFTSDWSIDDSGNIRSASDNCKILPLNLAGRDHPGKKGSAVGMPGKDEKSGCVPV